MADYVNFYENVKEAEIRLNHTVVLYDGLPYYVLCICDHKPDGIMRVYLDPLGAEDGKLSIQRTYGVPYEWLQESPNGPTRGDMMDKFLDTDVGKQSGILRKMMNSPKFNKFRPFPLGMVNIQGSVILVERQPMRQTQQGLTNNMLSQSKITIDGASGGIRPVNIASPELADTILNKYPSPEDCRKNLLDPEVQNTGAAFHRSFALIRGPIRSLFLAYKTDIVGFLEKGDFSSLRLADEFRYTKEVIEDLKLFNNVA